MSTSTSRRIIQIWEEHHPIIKAYIICVPLTRVSEPTLGWLETLIIAAFTLFGGGILWVLLNLVGHLLLHASSREKFSQEVPLLGLVLALAIAGSFALAAHRYTVDSYSRGTISCMEENRDWDASDDRTVINSVRDCIYNVSGY